ncbi:hypothetical protein NLJ89_g5297 [Agrocybe chaxingu]|uniref:Uncharacterized protein n=1 Tax=Agrocybe chaxingu TaxID=84603 RepID=A0A9W8MX15_9AGAR|nr:hypothetical protein NLJ89_g5297 [Agrocybe chaxingu]
MDDRRLNLIITSIYSSAGAPGCEDFAEIMGFKETDNENFKDLDEIAKLIASCHLLRKLRSKLNELQQDVVYNKFCALYLHLLVDRFLQCPPMPGGSAQGLVEEFRLNNTYMEMMAAVSHSPYFTKLLRSQQPKAALGKELMRAVAQRLVDLAPTWDRKMLNTPPDREPGYYESAAGTSIQMLSTLLAAFVKESADSPVRVTPQVKRALIPWLKKWEQRHRHEFLGMVCNRARGQLESRLKDDEQQIRRMLKNWNVCGKPGCSKTSNLKACGKCQTVRYTLLPQSRRESRFFTDYSSALWCQESMTEVEAPPELYTLLKSLSTPAHIASLAFGHAGHLFAGSDDGSLRVYDLSSFKVLKAIRGLGSEVSSVVCMKRAGSEMRDAWVAHGRKISKFQLESPKMIQNPEDALITIDVADTDADVLNELALNMNKSHLAFTLDSGYVGVIDLSTNAVTRMEIKHESVCGSVKFVPDRPRELVSGGYDTVLLHHDFFQGKVLSRRQMDPYSVEGGMALSPPFVMSMAMSCSGVIAAGTADGRLFIGFGGERNLTTKGPKKKAKKYEGLDEDETLLIKVAEGPIVAMAFSESRTLTVSTLMGILTQYNLIYEDAGSVVLQQVWQKESPGLEKVNALVADEKRLIVAGFAKDGRGAIEVWKQNVSIANIGKAPKTSE